MESKEKKSDEIKKGCPSNRKTGESTRVETMVAIELAES